MALDPSFYSGSAYSPTVRKSPIDNTDYELSDAYKPTGATTQPERSLTGGATASAPGAGANSVYGPKAPEETSSGLATSSHSNVVQDPYAPLMQHLSTASQNLESAYSAPHAGTARQIFGAILSRRNPGLGGLVSGETQRNRNIEQATQDYGIASSQIMAARAQQNQQVENTYKGAQTKEASAKADQATAEAAALPAKQKLEESQTTLAGAQAEAAHYKEDPNLGLVDLRTGQPVSQGGIASLTAAEAQALGGGKQEGDRVPLKVKNTASEIVNRGHTTLNMEEGVYDYDRNSGQKTRLGTNPRMMFSPENRIVQAAEDPNNPGVLTYQRAGTAMKEGATAPGSVGSITAKATAKAVAPGGKVGEEINAFQTAQQHADMLTKAITALHNGDEQTLNGMKNSMKNEFGVAGPVTAQAIADAYQREVTKMVSGGHMTDSEIASVGKTLDTNRQSPQQMLAVIGAYKGLAGSKLAIRKRNVQAGMQGKAGFDSDQAAPQTGTATHRFNPTTGQIEAIQ